MASGLPRLAASIALTFRRHLSARTIGTRAKPGPNRFLGIAGEVAVGSVDHRDARAHQSGELERRDAGGKRLGREGVAKRFVFGYGVRTQAEG